MSKSQLMGNLGTTSKWVSESISNFHDALELQANDYTEGFFHMINFTLKLCKKSNVYFLRLLDNVLATEKSLIFFLEIIHYHLKETCVLKKASTTIMMPSKNQEKLICFGNFLLLSYFRVHDFREFLALNINFDRLLHYLMYLQNLVSYNFLLAQISMTQDHRQSDFTFVDSLQVSQVIKKLLEFD